MKIFVDKIVQRYGTNVHWSLTGGEPTLNPDFIKLLEYLQDIREVFRSHYNIVLDLSNIQ